MRKLTTLLGLLLLLPAAAAAQAPGSGPRAKGPDAPPCGDVEVRDFYLAYFARYFTDDDLADVREGVGIERQPADFPRRVLEERQACGPVFGRMIERLDRSGEAERIREGGFGFALFRFGPYYGAVVVDRPREGAPRDFSTGWGAFYVFRASDLGFVGAIAG